MGRLGIGIDEVNKILPSITKCLEEVFTPRELAQHRQAKYVQLLNVQEVNPRLTMAMEGFQLSELSHHNFNDLVRPSSATEGPSMHPDQRIRFDNNYASVGTSLRDTRSDRSNWMRGGAGSNA